MRRHAHIRRHAPQARVYADWQELLAATKPLDALIVCLPPRLHAACGHAALAAGLAVYMEKPLAASLEEAEALALAARQSSRATMIGFNYRFHPLLKELQAEIQAGKIGRPVAVRLRFCTPAAQVPDWKRSLAEGGGALLDLGVHHIDLLRFLFGEEMIAVRGWDHSSRGERETVSLQIRLRQGVVVDALFSLATTDEFSIEIYGDRGSLCFDRQLEGALQFRPVDHRWTRREKLWRSLRAIPHALQHGPGHEPSFALALEAFVEAVATGTKCHPDFDDALLAQQILTGPAADLTG